MAKYRVKTLSTYRYSGWAERWIPVHIRIVQRRVFWLFWVNVHAIEDTSEAYAEAQAEEIIKMLEDNK